MMVSTGIIHTGIVYLLFFDSLRFLSTKFISIIVFLDPAVAIVLDTVFTGFRPDLYQTLGIVMIFAGMALTLVRRQGRRMWLLRILKCKEYRMIKAAVEGSCFCFISKRPQAEQEMNLKK